MVENCQEKASEGIFYEGKYPDMVEFEKPWESCVQVNQRFGAISMDGRALQSEGFSKCYALILRSVNTFESALFHVSDIDLTPEQIMVLQKLSKSSEFDVLFVRGSLSRDLRDRVLENELFSENLNIHQILDDIDFDSGRGHWNIVYKPDERKVYIDLVSQKKVLVFNT